MTEQTATSTEAQASKEVPLAALSEAELAKLTEISEFLSDITPGNEKALFQALATEKTVTHRVFIEDIFIKPGLNPRIDNAALKAHIRFLADSIKEHGFDDSEPLSVHVEKIDGRNRLVVNDGHCRYNAAVLAKSEGAEIESLPVVVKTGITIEEITFGFVRSQTGLKLTPIELAATCKRLRSFKLSEKVIAQKLGMTETYVNNLLALASAPRAIRSMVEEGEASAALAMNQLAKHGENATEVMTKALDAAKAAGKAKVTAKFMPNQIQKKALVKAAPVMYKALDTIANHPGFATMDDELKKLVRDVLKALPAADAEKAAADQSEGGSASAGAATEESAVTA